MLRHCTLVTGLLLVASLTCAQTTPMTTDTAAAKVATPPTETPNTPWTLTPTFVTQYMYRGVRLGGPAFQPSLEYDVGNLAVGVWSSIPIADKVPGQSDPEVDPYGSYKYTLSDLWSIQPGFYLYTYPRANRADGFYTYTFEPNLAFNFGHDDAMLTAKFYYDLIAKGPTVELTAAGKKTFGSNGVELDYSATGGSFIWRDAVADSEPRAKNWGNYYIASVTLYYPLAGGKIGLGLTYTKGTDNFVKVGTDPRIANSAAVGRLVGSLSYGYSF